MGPPQVTPQSVILHSGCPSPPLDFIVFLFVNPMLLHQTELGVEPQDKRDTSIDSTSDCK